MDDFIADLTTRLIDSFDEVDGIHPVDDGLLPSKRAVEEIAEQLLQLLFPGFYDNDPLKDQNIETVISTQLKHLHALLSQELHKGLEETMPDNATDQDIAPAAHDTARAFLKNLPAIRQLLTKDVEAAYDGDPAANSYKEVILAYPGLEAVAVHRLAHTLYNLQIALIPRMMTEWAHSRTGIDIHPGAKIGTHFFIDHGTGVVIGETTEIGHHVKIYHGVTLGARSTAGGQELRGVKRHPTIRDHVTIYPGATILGGQTVIGEHSTIGGNVFLIDEVVPPNHLVFHEKRTVLMKPQKPSKKQSAY